MIEENNITHELTYEMANKLLNVNYETGELTWKKRSISLFEYKRDYVRWNNNHSNKIAGTILKRGRTKYRRIKIFNRNYLAHRLVWLLKHKKWPNTIDHINGNGVDNRLSNLRDVTHKENQKNRRRSINCSTGIMGVRFSGRKWTVSIASDKGKSYIGTYSDFFEACCIRKSAENKYNYHPNHGTVKPL